VSVSVSVQMAVGIPVSIDDFISTTTTPVPSCVHPEAAGQAFCPKCGEKVCTKSQEVREIKPQFLGLKPFKGYIKRNPTGAVLGPDTYDEEFLEDGGTINGLDVIDTSTGSEDDGGYLLGCQLSKTGDLMYSEPPPTPVSKKDLKETLKYVQEKLSELGLSADVQLHLLPYCSY